MPPSGTALEHYENMALTETREGQKMIDRFYAPIPKDKRDPNKGLKMALYWVKRDRVMTPGKKKEVIMKLEKCLADS